MTPWSGNLSPGHSNFPLLTICGRRWRSVAVEDHLRSILRFVSVWESFTVGDQLRYSVLYTRQIFIRRELKHRHWDLFSETEALHQARRRSSGCCSCQCSPSLTVAGQHYPCSIICVPFLVNDSFTSSNFPDNVKLARLTAVFKKGSRFDKDNYRPISVLSNFSKLFEKAVSSPI